MQLREFNLTETQCELFLLEETVTSHITQLASLEGNKLD